MHDGAGRGFDVGYWLSSEEHGPRELVRHAVRAEAAGFRWAMISDHFHPWTPVQGQAPFVWSVLGALSEATSRLHLATGVTAPIMRIHPAIVAQAAATAAVQLRGRFALGVGAGERLNEHVTGTQWPRPGVRRRMLEEAVDVIKQLFAGDEVNHDGEWYTVEHATLFTRPDVPPPIWMAASGRRSAELAGRVADGIIGLQPDPTLVDAYRAAGGEPGARIGQLHVCIADDETEARAVAHSWWPNGALPGRALTELERPSDYQAFCGLVREDDVAEVVVCGSDPERHLAALARFAGAGYDRVYVHQVGPDQEAFFRMYEHDVLPAFVA